MYATTFIVVAIVFVVVMYYRFHVARSQLFAIYWKQYDFSPTIVFIGTKEDALKELDALSKEPFDEESEYYMTEYLRS